MSGVPPDPAALLRELTEFGTRVAGLMPALHAASNAPIGTTPRERVWQNGKVSLYRYGALARPAGVAPLLICFALVNRPYVLDLQPDRSLIRALLERGLDVYLIDWGSPDNTDRDTGLDHYINRYLDGAVRHVLESQAIESLNLLGVCQGGAFALCYTALQPARVRNLITMVTPVDFRTPENLLSKWVQGVDAGLLTANGNVQGSYLNSIYLALMPFRLMQQKYVALASQSRSSAQLENFMRMERWIFDSPDVAAAAFREFIEQFYQQNRLVRGGLEIGGHAVDLRQITQPVLNIYAERDHIVPPSASVPLRSLVASRDYETLAVDVGHIGMYVSSKAQAIVPAKIYGWLLERAGPQ
ncbi:MAG TPA: class III poly(R)-hydroxyalkanoic acid synthase subunit PhaC [Steroidobacteraceae bacterium]|nr:class III poly(R)-hydroxyalkanoic acid synthase subunit PhaC [Steroidobacteraceae bacterium]HRX88645.1 class III poly(R)-hydroxyalkanoic acid synthase subunit PhaC [Steroidobacteraceae bacterium]